MTDDGPRPWSDAGAFAHARAVGDAESTAFESAAVPLVVIDGDGQVLAVNAAGAALAGRDPSAILGGSLWQVLSGAAEQGENRLATTGAEPPEAARAGESSRPKALLDAFSGDSSRHAGGPGHAGRGRPVTGEVLWTGALGDRRRYVWTFTPMRTTHMAAEDQGCWVGAGVDVTEHRRNEAAWQRRAQTDPLTGLANRTVLTEVLIEHLNPDRGLGCGILFCDLDGFKQVNDTHGHHVGDDLLALIGQRLTESVRPGDLVARLGGDEFVVLLPGAGLVETRAVATRAEHAITRPARLESLTVRVGVSVGVWVARVGEDAPAVLREADQAMYVVKSRRARRASPPGESRP